jgi:hypothetical protein
MDGRPKLSARRAPANAALTEGADRSQLLLIPCGPCQAVMHRATEAHLSAGKTVIIRRIWN